jgi:hypothetical protein
MSDRTAHASEGLRYSRGEDVRPLLGALVGGVLGASLSLVIDRLVPSPAPSDMMLPALVSSLLPFAGEGLSVGVLLVMVLAVLSALVFVYGQFRRFVPGPPWAAGVAWGVLMAVAAASALAPLAAPSIGGGEVVSLAAALVGGLSVLFEIVIGAVAFGFVVGVVNPRSNGGPSK